MVVVQLPEAAIEHVEVLVAEEARSPVDVVLRAAHAPRLQELPFPALAAGDETGAAGVDSVHDPSGHRERVLVLKLCRMKHARNEIE